MSRSDDETDQRVVLVTPTPEGCGSLVEVLAGLGLSVEVFSDVAAAKRATVDACPFLLIVSANLDRRNCEAVIQRLDCASPATQRVWWMEQDDVESLHYGFHAFQADAILRFPGDPLWVQHMVRQAKKQARLLREQRDLAEAQLLRQPGDAPAPRAVDAAEPLAATLRDATRGGRRLHHDRWTTAGRLVPAVAHQLKNPLGGILALAQVLLRDCPLPEEDLDALHDIEEAAVRCKRIIDALQSLTHDPTEEAARPLDFPRILEATWILAQSVVKSRGISGRTVLDDDLPTVVGGEALVTQWLLYGVQSICAALPSDEPLGRHQITLRASGQHTEVWVDVMVHPSLGLSPAPAGTLATPLAEEQLDFFHNAAAQVGGRWEMVVSPNAETTIRLFLPVAFPDAHEGGVS